MGTRRKIDYRKDPHGQHVFAISRPESLREHLLALGMKVPGPLGRTCARRLRKRYLNKAAERLAALARSLPKGALCIDLGANVGRVSEILLDAGLRVIAFEPDPVTFAALQARVGQREGARLINAAAGTAAGRLDLMRPHGWDGTTLKGSDAGSLVIRNDRMDAGNAVEVEVIDFADFLRGLGEQVALLKIDIEGGEWELVPHLVTTGALSLADQIVVETHEWLDPARRTQAAEFRALAQKTTHPQISFDWI